MTAQTSTHQPKPPHLQGEDYVSTLVPKSLKPGSNMSFGLVNGKVTVTLDHLGDWTIMVGLSTQFDRIVTTLFSLERLGFFRATETEGSVYLLWTSALLLELDSRNIVENVLFETLKTLQRASIAQYIC